VKTRILTVVCFGVALAFVPTGTADEPKADKEQSINEISLEVQALRSFYTLKLTDEQLKQIAKFANETAEPAHKRKMVKVDDEYRKLLTNLRDALIAADDDDKIGDLEEELDQLPEKDKPDLDDSYDVTKGARKRAPEVIKGLTVQQLASYYGSIADDVQEPLTQLTGALESVRGLEGKEWTDKRDEVADEVAWSVAGLDVTKADKIRDKVVVLLTKAHSLEQDDFKAKKADLVKEATTLAGDVGPDTLLRHHAEHTVADLLSNPRLEAAIKARLK
jgi:hypothetical protein